ncbi:MAG: sigma-54 dependent transcriptional regulator [Isosphaeraceae bacterium]
MTCDVPFRVLLVGDASNTSAELANALAAEPIEIRAAENAEEALAQNRLEPCDLVITALMLSGSTSGLELVQSFKAEWPETRIVVLADFGTIPMAVEAMRLGADDYLTKPLDMVLLHTDVRDASERHRLREENRRLRDRLDRAGELPEMIGQSVAFRNLITQVHRVASTDLTVLIEGENGTGKELVARAIHRLSPRCNGPFIAANVGAMPDTLIESELFGYERGAFSGALRRKHGWFELARGGTLLLDELDEMPAKAQVDLLRILEQRVLRRVGGEELVPIDVRLVVTVQHDAEALVAEGRLREDLYYRLNVVPIRIPPLRERRDDVPLLVLHFLKEAERRHHREPKQIAGVAMRRLCDYSWPGNIRQLRNFMERLAVTVDGPVIHADDLPAEIHSNPIPILTHSEPLTLDAAVQDAEKRAIRAALAQCNNHREHTAALLGISVRALQYKLNRYSIS